MDYDKQITRGAAMNEKIKIGLKILLACAICLSIAGLVIWLVGY